MKDAICRRVGPRGEFIRRTYTHLAGAILAFVVMESYLLQWPGAGALALIMIDGYAWLIVLGAFMAVSRLANSWADSDAPPGLQYAGLCVYVAAEAVIFLPLLYVASHYSSPDVIPTAGIITGLLFGGLTLTAMTTRRDFSFLRGFLLIGGFVALGIIVASILLGFSLGLIFAAAMVIYAGGAMLYETSNIAQHYRTDQHVAASLALFASVALLFWYVLQVLVHLKDD